MTRATLIGTAGFENWLQTESNIMLAGISAFVAWFSQFDENNASSLLFQYYIRQKQNSDAYVNCAHELLNCRDELLKRLQFVQVKPKIHEMAYVIRKLLVSITKSHNQNVAVKILTLPAGRQPEHLLSQYNRSR